VLLDEALAADPRFCSNALRNAHRAELQAIIESRFAALTTAELEARLEAAGIANARMNDMAGLWAHPQLAARRRWVDIDTPAGRVPALRPPATSTAFEHRMDAIPAVGQHTRAVLRELGLDEAAIARLAPT
jgi:crotonobetainyl-CoA:carnitine CoA-transferase CaiB-like acyl-CoA transferase